MIDNNVSRVRICMENTQPHMRPADLIATRIIRGEAVILGLLAWELAESVHGLRLDIARRAARVTGHVPTVLGNLVAHYQQLFGRHALDDCRNAAAPYLAVLATNEVPRILRAKYKKALRGQARRIERMKYLVGGTEILASGETRLERELTDSALCPPQPPPIPEVLSEVLDARGDVGARQRVRQAEDARQPR